MSRWQIPDRPPRKRERSRWRQPPVLLLIVGITLLVFGLLATFGPLAFDLGGTDSPPADEPADDPPGADADASDASGDGTSGAEGNDGIGRTIDDVISGSDEPESAHGDEEREECFVE